MTLLELNTSKIQRKSMSIKDIFKTVGCSTGNNKHRKANEYIRYKLKDEWQSFKDDILKNGVKKPLLMKETDGILCIIDGYHRITAIKELSEEKKIKNIKLKVIITRDNSSKTIDMDF